MKAGCKVLVALVGFVAASTTNLAAAETIADGQMALDRGRPADARQIWTGLAERGDGEAGYLVGLLYDLGNGVQPDAAAAYRWYLRAAEAGIPAAAFNVAVLLDSGRGVGRDLSAAALWYARAAAAGHARAQYNLAQLYEAGEGVPRNPDAADAWYRRAAEGGVAAATTRLAALHRVTRAETSTLPVAPSPIAPAGSITAQAAVAFVWKQPVQPADAKSFIEVVALDSQGRHEVFADYSNVSALTVALPPQRYAWRVFAVSPDPAHYAASSWTGFTVQPRPAIGPGG